MDNSLLAVRDINHKYIVVERSGGYSWHIPVLYFEAGKEDHAETEKRNVEVFLMIINACEKCRKMTNIQKI